MRTRIINIQVLINRVRPMSGTCRYAPSPSRRRDAPADPLSTPRLRNRVGLSMRAYARWGCPAYAAAAAAHIELLLAHPEAALAAHERCIARALVRHLRCLAGCSEPAAQASVR